jgi:hypothetical protein
MFRIEERWPCAACHNKRTIRWGTDVEHCFNCRSQWPRLKPKPTAIFSEAEMQRLVGYRGAVRAGVYTDELTRRPQDLKWRAWSWSQRNVNVT